MDAEFRQLDTDKNNILSRKEIEESERSKIMARNRQRLANLFRELDRDRNGQLTAAEFAGLSLPYPPVNIVAVLNQIDGNRDGQVSLVEYRAGKLVNFDRMDADKDGRVSQAEMRAAGLAK
jgi:Ca2+-binding EF-hand superfamily protein